MIGYFLSTAISTIGTILIVRLISVEEYSLISIAYILPNILISFSELGLNFSSTHFIARKISEDDEKGVRDIIKINLFVKTLIGSVFMVYVAFFPVFIAKSIYNINDDRIIMLIQISSIGIISTILYEALNSFFLGAQSMQVVQFGSILRSVLRTGISVFLIILGFTLIGPLIGFVFSTLIVVIYFFIFLKKIYPKKKSEKSATNWSELSVMFRYGYPLMIGAFIAQIQNEIYFLILSNYGYIPEVSYLQLAITGAALIGIFKKAISQSLFPIFSQKNWKEVEDRSSIINYYSFSLKFETLLILPIAFFIVLYSGDIFSIIFGEAYRIGGPYFSLHYLSYFLIPIGSITIPAFLNGQKMTRNMLYIEMITFTTSVILALLLIPYFGGFAMFIGILFGKTLSIIYGNIIIYKKFGKELYCNLKAVFLIFLVAIISGIIIYIFYSIITTFLLSNELLNILFLIISFIAYIGLYLFLIGIFSLINNEEIDLIINSFEVIPILSKFFLILGKIEKRILKIRKR